MCTGTMHSLVLPPTSVTVRKTVIVLPMSEQVNCTVGWLAPVLRPAPKSPAPYSCRKSRRRK